MSFGSSSQQVRYALIVDDQATAKIQNINRQFQTMGTQTTALTTKFNTFNAAINNNSKTFNASVNSIKTQGNALVNNTKQLAANSTQVTTLGTKIKDTASRFSGFATGLAVTASGALQLAAGFRDFQDAQIAVERQQRKLSLAQEAYNKAQDKLKKLTDAGIKSGKAYAQAQLDVSQAQQQLSIMTQLLGERQEDLFDSQSQFITSLIPTSLGAIGTLGAAFRDLGGEKGLGGLVTKFKGLGTGITSSVIPAITNLITGGNGLTGLTDKLKGAGLSATGLKGNLLGLGVTTAVIGGITFGALELADAMNKVIKPFSAIKQPVSALEASVDKTGKSLDIFNQTLAETEAMTTAGVTPAIVALDATFKTHMTETLLKNAGYLDENGKQTQKFKDKIAEMNTKLIESGKIIPPVGKAVNDLGEGFKNSSADFAMWATNMLDSGKSAQQVATWLHDSHIKEADALKILDAAMIKHLENLGKLNSLQKIVASTNLFDIWEKRGGQMAAVIAGFGANIDTLAKKFGALAAAQKDLFGTHFDPSVLKFYELLNKGNLTAITKLADLPGLVNQVNTTAKELNKTWEVDAGKIAAENTTKALEKAKKAWEDVLNTFKQNQQALKATLKIDSNVDKIVKDFVKNLSKGFEKDFKLNLKIGQNKEDLTAGIKEFISGAIHATEKGTFEFNPKFDTAKGVKELGKSIIEGIDDTFGGHKKVPLDFKGLETQISEAMKKGPDAFLQFLSSKGFIGPVANAGGTGGEKWGTSFATSASKSATDQLKKALKNFDPSNYTADPNNTKQKGVFKSKDTSLFNIKIAPPVIPKPVTTEFDSGVKTLTTNVANISKTVPAISVNTKPAISLVQQLQKLWTNTQKIVPNLTVKNKQAISLVEQVQKLWTNTAKIQPTLILKNDKALKAIDVIAKRITSLPTGNVTVKVNYDTSGKPAGIKAQHGFHGTLTEDTTILAHKGERVDIEGLGETRKGSSGSGGGTGGGNLTINNIIDIGTERIVRTVKRKLGQGFYNFGA